jgi:hypothetical protein
MATVDIQARAADGHWETIGTGELYSINRPPFAIPHADSAARARAGQIVSNSAAATKGISDYARQTFTNPPSIGRHIDIYC